MGYFNRPIRRSAAGRACLAYLEPARDICPADWKQHDALTFAPKAKTYFRFAIDHPDGRRIGLFRSLPTLEDDAEFPPASRPRLRSILRWFNANLAVPRLLPQNAFFWFKSDAEESLGKMRILATLYRRVGRSVWMQTTADPGRVVYRDAHQVAAVPYGDRRIDSSMV